MATYNTNISKTPLPLQGRGRGRGSSPLLDVQNLTKSFGAQILFRDISFSVGEGQRVGLIARNGTGKSTLMKILMGDEGYDSGDIIYRNDIKVGFLTQTPDFDPEESVLDACFNHEGNEEKILKAKQILTQLKISDLSQPMGQLSGGQRKRVALANVLITEPDFLMLDEPTNHLDLDMIIWLEGFLQRGRKTLLMVTHDRYFLDRVCDTILELDAQSIYQYKGNYAYYLDKRQERIDAKRAEVERANNLYRRELEWMRRQPQARGHKAKYREDAFYELERVAKQRIEERQMRLKASKVYIGSKIFECQYVSKAFQTSPNSLSPDPSPEEGGGNINASANDKTFQTSPPTSGEGPGERLIILKDFYYNFARFEKMGIVGNNGTGKSTFIKMLLGEVAPDSGRFDIGETVRFGYFSQEGMEFDEQEKVIDVITKIADYIDLGGKKLTAVQLLQYFLFTPEQQYNYVYKLSGGERRKLYLCTVLMQNPNFLILDEPTNDLDIQTLQVLEQYLEDFPGCVIVVSHDRYFMDKVVDHLLVFHGEGNIKDFPGNYTQYRNHSLSSLSPGSSPKEGGEKKSASTSNKQSKNSPPTSGEGKGERPRRLTFKEKREFEQLEKDIEALETEKAKIEEALCSGTISVEEITKLSIRLPQLNDELDEKSMRWLELSEFA